MAKSLIILYNLLKRNFTINLTKKENELGHN
jgi:hypothetical protein